MSPTIRNYTDHTYCEVLTHRQGRLVLWYYIRMNKVIISLIGPGAVGKTSSAKYLAQNYGFTTFSFSDVIREYANSEDIPLRKRSDFALAHAQLLKERGWDYSVQKALSLQSNRICIDDVRSPRYAEIIRSAGGKDIAFFCPTRMRFAHTRNHPDKARYPDTIEGFIQNEQEDDRTTIGAGLAFDIDSLLRAADYHVQATGTLDDTFHQLDEIMKCLNIVST